MVLSPITLHPFIDQFSFRNPTADNHLSKPTLETGCRPLVMICLFRYFYPGNPHQSICLVWLPTMNKQRPPRRCHKQTCNTLFRLQQTSEQQHQKVPKERTFQTDHSQIICKSPKTIQQTFSSRSSNICILLHEYPAPLFYHFVAPGQN